MPLGRIIFFFFLLLTNIGAHAQMSVAPDFNLISKESRVFRNVKDSVINDVKSKGFDWPLQYVYIRSFKLEKELEIWLKNDEVEPFKLYKTYNICAGSGTFGPKRKEGDKQIPEGFYYINEWKPNSNYHMALGLNYPNASDQLLSDPLKPGGDIYIHGNCVTIGCLPITDSLIEHLYFLTASAKEQGQDFIPVHIYPYRFDKKKSQKQYLSRTNNKPLWTSFHKPLNEAYEYFENTHQVPGVLIDEKGNYQIAGNPHAPLVDRIIEKDEPEVLTVQTIPYEVNVDKVPVFMQGTSAYQRWLYNLSKEYAAKLPPEVSLALQLEFIVDEQGNTRFAKVVKGIWEVVHNEIINRFEKELKWLPAIKNGKPVASKLFQTLNLQAPEDLD
jgi:murein L,D-transpeptidase YafK